MSKSLINKYDVMVKITARIKPHFIVFIAVLVCFGANVTLANADAIQEECNDSQMSNATKYECLYSKSEALDVKLNAEIASIIKNLPKSGLWGDFDDNEHEKSFYERRAQEIVNANKQWIKFSEAECKMTAGVYEGGSGQGTADILCRIEQTKERINYLKFHEPYKSFRKNN